MAVTYFIAATPPTWLKAQIQQIHKLYPTNPGLSWYDDSKMVVAIRFFGSQVSNLDTAKKALHSLRTLDCVTAELGSHTKVLGQNVVYLPVGGLEHLAKAVRDMTQQIGQDENHEFVGRISIVKRKSSFPGTVQLPMIPTMFKGHFDVNTLFLMCSYKDPNGQVRYKAIDSVTLGHHCQKCGLSGNLFIAVVPPWAVTRKLGKIQYKYCAGNGVAWVPRNWLHVTLRFLGNMDKTAAIQAFRKLNVLQPVHGVKVQHHAKHFGKNVLYATVDGLNGLAHAVWQRTMLVGVSPNNDFRSQLKLARAPSGIPLPNIEIEKTDEFDVHELVLMQSSIEGFGNKRYDIIERITLCGH